ncbi:MAG TPA: single-stranded-DNA-specific exonuclease RecJ [Anaerolineales bacterium]|nr:single-stranded-DNA-specific exonuclease RecJ [Anaerolineales bacterium]
MALVPAVKRWEVRPPIPPEVDADLSGIDSYFSRIVMDRPRVDPASFYPVIHQLLYNRGLEDPVEAGAFLEARPPFDPDPFQLSGMETAVERIQAAIDRSERVAVYGDYDVDGLTAAALLVDCLTRLGADATPYIPNRFDEGYGLNIDALESLQQAGISLVISVDCGIRSVEEAIFARDAGLDLIISDHHHPGVEIPPALVVINPRLDGDPYPDKNLTGVGIAYKIASALSLRYGDNRVNPAGYLDLVALGTVADVASLTGENRALVKGGLRLLSRSGRLGLASLQGVSGLRGKNIQAQDIGFVLGPRLNAAGRLESAENAYRLLVSGDIHEAGTLAQLLDDSNKDRQKITRETQEIVEGRLGDGRGYIIADADEGYHAGIVGLVASRIMNKYHRPVLLAHRGDLTTTGSCRSIPEFHIAEALDRCQDLLIRHGGHRAAAGFTVANERWDELLVRLESIAAEELDGLDLQPVLMADLEISLGAGPPFLWALLEAMDFLQPTGVDNPEPLFVSRDLTLVSARPVGKDGSHLKLTVKDGRELYDAIAFRLGDRQLPAGTKVDLAYTLEANEYRGETSLQLNVKDIRTAGA